MNNNQPHTIEITISIDGKITGEVKGMAGPTCTSLTKWLDEIGHVEVDKHTPDFHKRPDQNLTNRR